MTPDTSKREFLQLLSVATLALPMTHAWAQFRPSKNPFGLGVASGSPSSSSVVLWTRLYDEGIFGSNLPNENIPLKWEVSTDKEFKAMVQQGQSLAVAGLAHSVHTEVTNLAPNTWFYYRFLIGPYTSEVGKTRTFAEPTSNGQKTLKFAFASCQHFEHGYFNAYTHMVQENPDLILFLGDYIYEYAPGRSGIRLHSGSWCLSLSDYRKRYEQYKLEPELQLAHAACPWIFTWDDHEVQNDYAGLSSGSFGPFTNFAKRRANAYQAYYEHMPLKSSFLIEGLEGLRSGSELRLYENYQFGTLANITMLDTRQYRDKQACNPNSQDGSATVSMSSCEELQDASRTLLGEKQETWLDHQFKNSAAQTWNIIGQSTLFGARVYATAEGKKVWNDGWDGYPVARKKLTQQLINHQVSNPVIVGGDVHEYWVGYLKEDYSNAQSKVLGVEFCGTSITSNDGKNTASRQRANPHFIYAEGLRRGYCIAELHEESMTVQLRAVKDITTRSTEIETLAIFRVLNGSKTIERVPVGIA